MRRGPTRSAMPAPLATLPPPRGQPERNASPNAGLTESGRFLPTGPSARRQFIELETLMYPCSCESRLATVTWTLVVVARIPSRSPANPLPWLQSVAHERIEEAKRS